MLDTPHWTPDDPAAQRSALRRALADTGLTPTNFNANDARLLATSAVPEPRPLDPDPDWRAALMAWHEHCLEFAAEFGAPVSIATGPTPDGLDPRVADDHLRAHLDRLVPRAAALGATLSIEFEPGHHIHSWATLVPWLEAYPGLRANFDIGHAAVAGEDIVATLREALPRVANIHFEDIAGRVHEHLVPGTGDLPLGDVVELLDEAGYTRGVTVELYNHADRAGAALEGSRAWFAGNAPRWLTL